MTKKRPEEEIVARKREVSPGDDTEIQATGMFFYFTHS